MRFKTFKTAAAAAAVAATLAAGCGMAPSSQMLKGDLFGLSDNSGPAASPGGVTDQSLTGQGQAAGPHRGFHRHGFDAQVIAQLGLSSAQRQQLKAIAQKYRSERASGGIGAHWPELKGILTAPTVDATALRSFIGAREADAEGHSTRFAAMLGEMRAVLTDGQRAKLVAYLSQAQPDHKKEMGGFHAAKLERFLGNLHLTAQQQAAFQVVETKVADLRQTVKPKLRSALAAFVQSGDQDALAGVFRSTLEQGVPADDLVAAVSSLDLAQRQQIVDRVDALMGRLHHRHHWGS